MASEGATRRSSRTSGKPPRRYIDEPDLDTDDLYSDPSMAYTEDYAADTSLADGDHQHLRTIANGKTLTPTSGGRQTRTRSRPVSSLATNGSTSAQDLATDDLPSDRELLESSRALCAPLVQSYQIQMRNRELELLSAVVNNERQRFHQVARKVISLSAPKLIQTIDTVHLAEKRAAEERARAEQLAANPPPPPEPKKKAASRKRSDKNKKEQQQQQNQQNDQNPDSSILSTTQQDQDQQHQQQQGQQKSGTKSSRSKKSKDANKDVPTPSANQDEDEIDELDPVNEAQKANRAIKPEDENVDGAKTQNNESAAPSPSASGAQGSTGPEGSANGGGGAEGESSTPAVRTVAYGKELAYGEDPDDAYKVNKNSRKYLSSQKRWKTINDVEKKVWTHLSRSAIPKVQKLQSQSTSSRLQFSKRLSTLVSREAKRSAARNKPAKDITLKGRRIMREVLMYWKGNEKREREDRKKAEKEAYDRARKEEELREAKRQQRKLNFLITQTELYSHFVDKKIRTQEHEESADTGSDQAIARPPPPSDTTTPAPESAAAVNQDEREAAHAEAAAAEKQLQEIDFDDEDESNMREHAKMNAQAALDLARQRASDFDQAHAAEQARIAAKEQASKESSQDDAGKEAGEDEGEGDGQQQLDTDEMFQNPSSIGSVEVTAPKLLMASLKEYQLKGLTWLANLYEQGINGILADEMGLGKTVQSIALLAYLAEVHNIWGPFLVIAPASTLHNWQQEITRFVPALKALPYWGNPKDRQVLRKFWNRKSLRYDKDADFHVLVTSYQMVVADEQYFQRVKWQYMVLDEAQAIKSSSSARWKTLLGFQCRNRLLLTGTPIQNSMQELWALLHFIMPSLFDSHDEFSEWFSKGIEGNSENKGLMNDSQLRRLHMILKPFMLRRIKKNVQHELGDKLEIDVYCDLTPRQKLMYNQLRSNMSIADLIARAQSFADDDSVKRLMNLIMQFRKVCNHPELFERADVRAPVSFSHFNHSVNLIRENDFLVASYATHSKISYTIPRTFAKHGLAPPTFNDDTQYIRSLMDIWTPENVKSNEAFNFSRIMDMSPSQVIKFAKSDAFQSALLSLQYQDHIKVTTALEEVNRYQYIKQIQLPSEINFDKQGDKLPSLTSIYNSASDEYIRLLNPNFQAYMPKAVAPPIDIYTDNRKLDDKLRCGYFNPNQLQPLFGLDNKAREDPVECERFSQEFAGVDAKGLFETSPIYQVPTSSMQVPQAHKLILDSGKLAKLDSLLTELKAGGHRVLIYFQMTRMIDLMEEYLAYRQHKYLRLDGSSSISERRDMVMDWQTRPDLFIFLLSTRAGGLGINLTAADTVVFYDSDWNPSNDSQAMDRAHRLGQTKKVTVYRLITKNTIDERIVQLARAKKNVQDAVVGSSTQSVDNNVAKPNEVVSLLLSQEEMEETLRQQEAKRKRIEEKQVEDGKRGARIRDERKKKRAKEQQQKETSQPSTAPTPTAAASSSSFSLGGGGSNGWSNLDDDDAFGFFSNIPVNSQQEGGEEDESTVNGGGGDATPEKASSGGSKKRPRKGGRASSGNTKGNGGGDAEKPKRKRKKLDNGDN